MWCFTRQSCQPCAKPPNLEDQGAVQSGPSPLNQSGTVEQARSDRLLPSQLLGSQGHASLPTTSRHRARGGKNCFAFQMVCDRERMFTHHLQRSHIVWWSVNNNYCSTFVNLMTCRNHRQSKEINKNITKPFLLLSHFVLFCSLVLKLQGMVTETVT